MGTLVIVRHGESRWNICNRFTGWVDVPLSENGIKEAQGRTAVVQHPEDIRYRRGTDSRPPGGETLRETFQRAQPFDRPLR